MELAGITPRYFSRAQEGRSTNLILNLARALGVPPSELFGIEERLEEEPLPVDGEKLKRITVAARMMTAQVAALVYVASNGDNVDPCELMRQVISQVMNGDFAGDHGKSK